MVIAFHSKRTVVILLGSVKHHNHVGHQQKTSEASNSRYSEATGLLPWEQVCLTLNMAVSKMES